MKISRKPTPPPRPTAPSRPSRLVTADTSLAGAQIHHDRSQDADNDAD